MSEQTAFHPAYFTVRFRTDSPIREWAAHFFIITAYATTGETWSDERNIQADQELQQELMNMGRTPVRITGFDPESGHSEPGWAVELPVEDALLIGHRFKQDSIFRVEDDVLSVARCTPNAAWTTVGEFRERTHSM